LQRFYQVLKQAFDEPFAKQNLVHFFFNNAAINRVKVNLYFVLFFIEAVDFVAVTACHFKFVDFVALR
jgi:hypothetical protein